MGIINILDTATSNMIAAGEVVDRPASSVKELIENAIDAGASSITVEIRGGGSRYIRVTDNGKGIAKEDLPKTILRHATSKIAVSEDLDGVMTLGFRGEALAAISSVSLLEIISKRPEDKNGNCLSCNEDGVTLAETGCPDGTSVIVKELYYNVPARQKFLKRDATEAAAVEAVTEKAAISHPEISFKFITDGTEKFSSAGDGKLFSAIYSVCGREFANSLNEIDYAQGDIHVYGYTSKPVFPKGSRASQSFFVNARYVRSKTVMAALEEAYRSYLPSGKFPAAVLFVCVNPKFVDVNVHPAKTEIKFADEKKVFEAVYCAVKNSLTHVSSVDTNKVFKPAEPKIQAKPYIPERISDFKPYAPAQKPSKPAGYEVFVPKIGEEDASIKPVTDGTVTVRSPLPEMPVQEIIDAKPQYRIIGEAYSAYIFAQLDDRIYIIDKHAAHERLLYENLKDRKNVVIQELLQGVAVRLSPSEADIIIQNATYLADYGFIVEPFGNDTVMVRSVPLAIAGTDNINQTLEAFAASLSAGSNISFAEKCDKALFTVACKAAIKAGQRTFEEESKYIVESLIENSAVRYCPHGRPIIKEISKRELEKFFDR